MRQLCLMLVIIVLISVNVVVAQEMSKDEVKSILIKATELYRAKQYDQAVEQYELILKYLKDDAGDLYNAACTYSLAGRVKKAISILKQAVEAGWDSYDHMNSDPDLDNIRDESDFKTLMADLLEKVTEEEKKLKFWLNPNKTVTLGKEEFELIGTPTDSVPETARRVRDMQPFNNEIYIGYGDGMKNLGPVALVSFQPDKKEWKYHFMLQEHLMVHFCQIGDELYIPGAEPYEAIRGRNYIRNYDFGNIYRLFKHGGYVKYRTVPVALHIQGITELKGKFYCTAGTANETWSESWGCVLQSTDGCAIWTPVYNTEVSDVGTVVIRMGGIRSFKKKVYAFGFAFTVNSDGKFVYFPDFSGEDETVVYDNKSWSTKNLIRDSGLLNVSDVDVFNGHLILNAHFKKTEADSLSPDMCSKLYIYNGTGAAKKVLDETDAKIEDIFITDDDLYLLLQKEEERKILQTENLKDFETIFTVPSEMDSIYCITVHKEYLYFGTTKGDIYRTKM